MSGEPQFILRRAPGHQHRARLSGAGLSVAAAIGRNGISSFKREGDGATPRGELALVDGFYRADRLARPKTMLAMRAIRADMGWCDEPWNAAYNRLVRLPISASHEEMKRVDALYDIVLVLDWNVSSRVSGRGSAIFMHLARPGYGPTEGCIAVARTDMDRLLPLLRPGTRIAT